jgi:adenylate cyclase
MHHLLSVGPLPPTNTRSHMGEQHERRFLVTDDYPSWGAIVAPFRVSEIRQGYVTVPGAEHEVRIRAQRRVDVPDADTVFTTSDQTLVAHIAIKQGHGTSRQRDEPEISQSVFDELWPATEGRRLTKHRAEYEVASDGRSGQVTLVIDRFAERLAPFVMAEFKFRSREFADVFLPPSFAYREVTEDVRYENASIACLLSPPSWHIQPS